MALPLKTIAEDLHRVTEYLRSQVGWVTVSQVKTTIPTKHADNRKLEAMRFLELIERDADNIKLTDDGRAYATSTGTARQEVLASRLRNVPIYHRTLEWMHHNAQTEPTKTDIANHWHDNYPDETEGATGDALTDAVIFFMRMAEEAGLGKFTPAGGNRESHLKMDTGALSRYVGAELEQEQPPHQPPPPPSDGQPPGLQIGGVTLRPGLTVNVEIHIAADAESSTIEEIFKNMRRYILTMEDEPPSDEQ